MLSTSIRSCARILAISRLSKFKAGANTVRLINANGVSDDLNYVVITKDHDMSTGREP